MVVSDYGFPLCNSIGIGWVDIKDNGQRGYTLIVSVLLIVYCFLFSVCCFNLWIFFLASLRAT